MTITEFLEARIAGDEAQVHQCGSEIDECQECGLCQQPGSPYSRIRLLAECAAKQWVLDTLRSYEPNDEWDTEPDMGKRGNNAAGAVRGMAAVYKDHPDYDPEWALS